LPAAQKFIFTHFHTEIEAILQTPQKNWKAILQDYSQKKHQRPPIYKVMSETGPDHSKQFVVCVYLDDKIAGEGLGSSKKVAQQAAAQNAVTKLKIDGL
jgi:ribonuclease-3